MPTLLRTNKEIMEIYDRQVDTVYRVCYAYMKNAPEAEDMTQETFLRLMSNGKPLQTNATKRRGSSSRRQISARTP